MVQILQFFGAIWGKNALNLVLIFYQNFLIYAETAAFNGAIWDEFSEQNLHQSIKKSTLSNARLALFLMLIRCRFNAHLFWVANINMINQHMTLKDLCLTHLKIAYSRITKEL